MAWACSIAIRRDSSSTNSLCASCSLDDVDLLDVLEAARASAPVRMQTMQRAISATPWSITSAPAIGMTDLKW